MKAYFVSDLHLADPNDAKTALFSGWLEGLGSQGATHLFLVGDIFDLWIGSHEYFKREWARVVAAVRALVNAGVEVHFFEGNHDLHLAPFWQDEIGVRVHADSAFFDFGPTLHLRVEHGDLINPADKGYLFLRWLLRTPVMRALAMNLPAWAVARIGERASRLSRAYTSSSKELPREEIRTLIHQHAQRCFAQRPFDFLITGHVHLRDDWQLPSGSRSVNLGSWFERPTALVMDAGASGIKVEFVDLA